MQYEDGEGTSLESNARELESTFFNLRKKVPDAGSRIVVVVSGLEKLTPRYIALHLYLEDNNRNPALTILGELKAGAVHFNFPKVRLRCNRQGFHELEVIPETAAEYVTFTMELVVGDRWIMNCPLV